MTRFASDRPSLTKAQRVKVFDAAGGVCHICGGRIHLGQPWNVEHVRARSLGGADSADNYRPAHLACHKPKTAVEATIRAKADRVRGKHIGAKPAKGRALPCGRDSRFKKKLNGEVVPR
jgi:5-methylcytosine-specific restriction protein A